uniref:Uncharacterized protein n=2 Tax=Anguilla anguilla TaxID=7936 RepID=A0A0E9TIK0_ANGAN
MFNSYQNNKNTTRKFTVNFFKVFLCTK